MAGYKVIREKIELLKNGKDTDTSFLSVLLLSDCKRMQICLRDCITGS